MTLKEVQQIAKNMGITPKKMNKTQVLCKTSRRVYEHDAPKKLALPNCEDFVKKM